MKNIARTIAFLTSAFVIMVGFQNCTGGSSSQPTPTETSALQVPPPWEALSPAQATLLRVTGSNPSTKTDIQSALVDLRAALIKVQNIDVSSYGGSFRQEVLDLTQRLTAEINKLESALAALGIGGGASACSFNGQTISGGSSVTAFETSSVLYGQTCTSETRTCSNGQLSGSFTFAACTPKSIPSSVPMYSFTDFATLAHFGQGPVVPAGLSGSLALHLYSEPTASSIPVYQCDGTLDIYLHHTLSTYGCAAGLTNQGIAGYISNLQLPNSTPVYQSYAYTQTFGFTFSTLYSVEAQYSICMIMAAPCTQVGWVPAN